MNFFLRFFFFSRFLSGKQYHPRKRLSGSPTNVRVWKRENENGMPKNEHVERPLELSRSFPTETLNDESANIVDGRRVKRKTTEEIKRTSDKNALIKRSTGNRRNSRRKLSITRG